MKPIDFPQRNKIWAEHQKEYLPLPAYSNQDETITCWQLTWRERFRIFIGGVLWLRQLNFSRPLQPQKPQLEDPFRQDPDL